MSTVSTKLDRQVKLKLTKLSALPDSDDPQLRIPPADQAAKPAQIQDLQKTGPGVSPWHFLEELIRVPIPVHYKSKLSLRIYYFLAVLDAHQGDRQFSSPSITRLALECRVSERQIMRWLAKLKRLKYIWVDGRGKRNRYRVNRTRKMSDFVFVDPRWVYRLGLSINEAVVLGYVFFRHNHKPETWFSNRRAARDLGLAYNTIRRCRAVIAAYEITEITPGRLSGGRTNRCQLADFGWAVSWKNYPKRARPKCHLLRNTVAAQRYSYANAVRNGSFRSQFGLSFSLEQDQEVHRLLRSIGTADSVARPMAFEQRYLLADVEQALINGAAAANDYCRRTQWLGLSAPRFNLAGYTIRTLNGAYCECHGVPPTRLARAAKARDPGGARAAAGSGVTAVCHRARVKEQIRRLRSALAKPYTPQELEKFAEERRLPDKKTQGEFLTAHLTAARRRDYGYRRLANLPQKVGFSLDKAG